MVDGNFSPRILPMSTASEDKNLAFALEE